MGHLSFCPLLRRIRDAQSRTGYVATQPTCGPFLIMPPAPKRWGPSRWHILCSKPAHIWATSDFVPRPDVLGAPRRKGLCSHGAHLCFLISFPALKHLGPAMRQGLCSHRPTYGPPLILCCALKCWGPPTTHGSCSHAAQFQATSDFGPCSEVLGTPQEAWGRCRPTSTSSPTLKHCRGFFALHNRGHHQTRPTSGPSGCITLPLALSPTL